MEIKDKQDNVEMIYPASALQQGMLFHSMMEPGTGVYIVQLGFQMDGPFNAAAFWGAWDALINRHAVFRTIFFKLDTEKPLQVVRRKVKLPKVEKDWTDVNSDALEASWQQLTAEERVHNFDTRNPPLMRLVLVKCSEKRRRFLWTHHHALLDGWSLAIVLGELFQLYNALSSGAQASLPPTRPFRDFIVHSQKQNPQEAEAFWARFLKGVTRPTRLQPSQISYGKRKSMPSSTTLCFDLETTARIRELAKAHKTTLNVLTQMIWALLVARYSGERDVVYGVTLNGRPASLEGFESMVGAFINTVPMRVDLTDSPTFERLITRIHRAQLDVEQYQSTPLVTIQRQTQIRAGQPLFDSLILFENFPTPQQATGQIKSDLQITPLVSLEETNYLINLFITPAENLTVRFNFDSRWFDETRMQRITGHFQTITHILLADVYSTAENVAMLTPDERREVLAVNETTLDYDRGMTIVDCFEHMVKTYPLRTALVCGFQELTYEELDRRANLWAYHLRSLGVGPESRVALSCYRSIEMVVGLLAILKAGGAYVPLDPDYPEDRLRFILHDADVSVLLKTSQIAFGDCKQVVNLDLDIPDASGGHRASLGEAEHPAYLIYTSGSTGIPKGVVVTHRNVVNFFHAMDRSIGSTMHNDIQPSFLALTSISFDISVLELFWTLGRGYRVVLSESNKQKQSGSENRSLDFSLFYFSANENNLDPNDKYRLLLEGVKFADDHNFHSAWVPERHFHEFGGLYPNPAITATMIAMTTKNLKIRAGSVVTPLHDPIRLAEDWSMVDNVSGGRVGLAFASGWVPNDFVLAPDNFNERYQRNFSLANDVRSLWRGESLVRPNGNGVPTPTAIRPKPIQSELPFWYTAAGNPETFRAAGRAGANVLTHMLGQNERELKEKIEIYRKARAEAGLDPTTGRVTLMLHTFIGADIEEVRRLVEQPFKEYLRSSITLLQTFAKNMDLDPETEQQAILDSAFKRYFKTSALLGTPESCMPMIEKIKRLDVDEIGCLIDFGVDEDKVLAALPQLDRLRQLALGRETDSSKLGDEPDPIRELLKKHHVTHLQCTPSFASMLLQDERCDFSGVEKMLVGGEAFPKEVANQLYQRRVGSIYNMYGPTETTIWSCVHEVSSETRAELTIGRPVANNQLYILDSRLKLQPKGLVGEIYIGGEGVTRGYWRRPSLSATRFLPDPFSTHHGARMYRTGDFALMLENGELRFFGRADNQVKIQGHRIELGEIEAALNRHDQIAETVVTNRSDGYGGTQLVAYMVYHEGSTPEASQLTDFLRASLPAFMVPHFFVPMEAFPLTPNGKVNRLALPAPNQAAARIGFTPPSTDTEAFLAEIWAEILKLDRVGVDEDFFEIGGHSLLVIRVASRLYQKYQIELGLQAFFDSPTVSKLAKAVDAKCAKEAISQHKELSLKDFRENNKDVSAALTSRDQFKRLDLRARIKKKQEVK